MKEVIILRGLPGSGKSSLANELSLLYPNKVIISEICSADQYFLDDQNIYKFDASKLKEAHEYCRKKFDEALNRTDLIIIDNTNTQYWEYEYYLTKAREAGYETQVITVGEFTDQACELYASRNTHGVPLDKIRQMRDRFKL